MLILAALNIVSKCTMLREKKIIALVGRPNVGKSTLFNRLSCGRKTITHDFAGVTRDRIYTDGRLGPIEFTVVDTPGLEEAAEDKLESKMMQQTLSAVEEADLVCLIVDGREGVIPTDKIFAKIVRKANDNCILIANKCERGLTPDSAYFKLGFGAPIAISSEHGDGMNDLYDELTTKVDFDSGLEYEDPSDGKYMQIAVVGRPNSGKSTFINSLLGTDRMLVGPEAGVTRESVTVDLTHNDQIIKLVDTAGLRRQAKVTDSLEVLSTQDATSTIRYANTVILMLDATRPLEHQELTIANYTIKEGRSLIIAINKWDLIAEKNRADFQDEFNYKLSTLLPQVKGISVAYISAIDGNNIGKVLDNAFDIYQLWNKKIPTSKLNEWLGFVVSAHPPPTSKKLRKKVRIKYVTQTRTRPPTFRFFCNDEDGVGQVYERYLINSLRESFDLDGVPIRLSYAKTANPYEGKSKKR